MLKICGLNVTSRALFSFDGSSYRRSAKSRNPTTEVQTGVAKSSKRKLPFYKRLTPGTRQGTPDKQMSPSTLLLRIDGGMLYDKSSDVLQFKKACAHLRADARSPPRLSPDVL
ncbi:hypothetical protein OUZ56_004317 [Daphnia magna]|uniref:Uncharacterized protein n=1 Tax=Daphnia magna TaxID=35525 RepID=A0ABQ9YPE7_9CRUS|nr:hypothetical protein OUZ56_004317 [Daphnia magna]